MQRLLTVQVEFRSHRGPYGINGEPRARTGTRHRPSISAFLCQLTFHHFATFHVPSTERTTGPVEAQVHTNTFSPKNENLKEKYDERKPLICSRLVPPKKRNKIILVY